MDLVGYQDFKWGMPRSTVESILKKQKVEIVSSDGDEIVIQSRIDLDGFPPSVDIKKGFVFLDNLLGQVSLSYKNRMIVKSYSVGGIFPKFRDQLEKKYGKCDQVDTTTLTDDIMSWGSYTWTFRSGDITLFLHEFSESSEYKTNEHMIGLETLSINYSKKGFYQEMKRAREKKTSREF
jgi:hypothetical protein